MNLKIDGVRFFFCTQHAKVPSSENSTDGLMDGSLREVRPRQTALSDPSAPCTRACSSVAIFSFEHIGQMSSSWDTMVAEDFDPFKVPFMLSVS